VAENLNKKNNYKITSKEGMQMNKILYYFMILYLNNINNKKLKFNINFNFNKI